jgi:hypothetical protein
MDQNRVTDAAVPFYLMPSTIIDIVFDTAPYVWNSEDRFGTNADSPQTTNIYVSIVSPNGTPSGVITFRYLPLES